MDTTPVPGGGEASRALGALAEAYWETRLDESPATCTYLGIDRGQDRLDERGPAARARRESTAENLRVRLEALPPGALEGEDRLTRAILHRMLSEETESYRHRAWEWELDPLAGPHIEIQDVVGKHVLETPAHGEALVARFREVPGVFDALVGDLRDGLASGRVAPRVAYERVRSQLGTFLATPAGATSYDACADRLPPSWPGADRESLARRLREAVTTHVRPAYESLLAFLDADYAGKARATVGVASIPGGTDAYGFAARRHTTTTLSPERIHRIGVEELERNEAEMLEIAKADGHDGDLRSYLDVLGRDPRFRLGSREEVLARYASICARMDARLPEAFRRLPRRGYEIRALEAWREADAPAAYYQPPPVTGDRPGIFYANTHDPSSWPTYDMETLSFHEAVPGHHLQIALAQEQEGIPTFRRHSHFTAYIEGWAHYTERLADELGAYSTPHDRLGMLAGQAWRAVRLVVDTGMHAMGWSRSRAVETMRRVRSGPESDVENEVDRYIVWPGQALAYKIGQRTMSEIRERARRRLGAAFRLDAFHDAVLRHGALPLSLLEDVVRLWDGR